MPNSGAKRLRTVSERKSTGSVFFEEINSDPYASLILTPLVKELENIKRTALPLSLQELKET
jgi:hypothetical protein